MRALNIAATGMLAQQMRVETISQNLANMSTTGYNARRAEFADLHYQQQTRPGTINATDGTVLPTGVQLGLGVRPASVSMEITQGALAQTGGPWLGGPAFSAVDAFYAPVAFRLQEYALSAPGTDAYADGLRAHPAVARWVQMAKDDPRRLPHYDVD